LNPIITPGTNPNIAAIGSPETMGSDSLVVSQNNDNIREKYYSPNEEI
jgi:hypothetical protein